MYIEFCATLTKSSQPPYHVNTSATTHSNAELSVKWVPAERCGISPCNVGQAESDRPNVSGARKLYHLLLQQVVSTLHVGNDALFSIQRYAWLLVMSK